jgi:hypothetical protein
LRYIPGPTLLFQRVGLFFSVSGTIIDLPTLSLFLKDMQTD